MGCCTTSLLSLVLTIPSFAINSDIGNPIAIFNSKIYYLGGRDIDPRTHQSVLKVRDLNSGKLCWEYLVEPPKTERPHPC